MVFEIDSIQHDNGGVDGYAANVDINRVWAQAWHLLQSGEVAPEMGRDDLKKSEERNRSYAVTTLEMETLLRFYEEADEEGLGVEFSMTSQLLQSLNNETGLKLTLNNLGAAIKRLGWVVRSKRTVKGGNPVKGFLVRKLDRPGSFEAEDNDQKNDEETPF